MITLDSKEWITFWEQVDITPNGCWNWKGSMRGKYGRFYLRRKYISVHRLVYLLYNNIPDNKLVRHKCDNPICCNPSHLQIGTHKDNSQDMVNRNRQAKGEQYGNSKLSNQDVVRIVEWYQEPESPQVIADYYEVDRATILRILKGDT